jgi:hypothetical protein
MDCVHGLNFGWVYAIVPNDLDCVEMKVVMECATDCEMQQKPNGNPKYFKPHKNI